VRIPTAQWIRASGHKVPDQGFEICPIGVTSSTNPKTDNAGPEVTKEMPQPSKAESVGIEKRKQMTDSDEEGAVSISVASGPA
jgi:hypothetical protein